MAYQFVREPLTTENADRLCNACETIQEKMIIWVLLDTGLRINELCLLTDKDVLWQQREIRVVHGKAGPYGGPKKRVVPMASERSRRLLEGYFSTNDKWFVKKRQAQEIITRVANRAKISQKVSAHVLRHTFACFALQDGISVASLAKVMGHNNIAVTNIYLQFTNIHITDEFERKWNRSREGKQERYR